MLNDQTNDTFSTLSNDQLDAATGGGWMGKVAKFAGKKVLGPVSAAWTAYDGVKGYLDARDQGKGVGESMWEGAKSAVW
jgi:hypothetical protein